MTYGPIKFPADVVMDEDKPGLYKIIFNPRGPGTYKVWVAYGGKLVKGRLLFTFSNLDLDPFQNPEILFGRFITQTRPCNIQQYFTAVEISIFR